MSELSAHPVLGLGDKNFDPDILTKEVDYDFFDDPIEISNGVLEQNSLCATDFSDIQQEVERKATVDSNFPHEDSVRTNGNAIQQFLTSEIGYESGMISGLRKNVEHEKLPEKILEVNAEAGKCDTTEESEMSGGSSNLTGNLGMESDQPYSAISDLYSMESNATSPNYPRPKQCYQLQQRKKSAGSIKKSNWKTSGVDPFLPINDNECGLTGKFEEMSSGSSSSDDGLSDSSESELASLDSDDEEFVDMLEKYFDYIDQDSDCSDLTEVSPLSSLTASPIPSAFLTDAEVMENLNLENALCLATNGLQIQRENIRSPSQFTKGELQAAFQNGERDVSKFKPRLPLIISTTETIAVHGSEEKARNLFEVNNGANIKSQDRSLEACLGATYQVLSREQSPARKASNDFGQFVEEDTRTYSSANSSQSIDKDDSSRSLLSAWSHSSIHHGKGGKNISSASSVGSRSKRRSKNFTFTAEQLRKIERENHILLRKILDTHKGHHVGKGSNRNVPHRTISASSATARIRHQRRVEQENFILMKRLQNVKPSKEIGDAFKAAKN